MSDLQKATPMWKKTSATLININEENDNIYNYSLTRIPVLAQTTQSKKSWSNNTSHFDMLDERKLEAAYYHQNLIKVQGTVMDLHNKCYI